MSKEDIKILLVDDENQFVDTLIKRLARRGFEARGAYDGPSALEAVTQPTDVMVLDLSMPGMDGFEVLRTVKRTYPTIQVIMLAGYGSDVEEQTAYKLGAHSFLRKPMDIDELLTCVRNACCERFKHPMLNVACA